MHPKFQASKEELGDTNCQGRREMGNTIIVFQASKEELGDTNKQEEQWSQDHLVKVSSLKRGTGGYQLTGNLHGTIGDPSFQASKEELGDTN